MSKTTKKIGNFFAVVTKETWDTNTGHTWKLEITGDDSTDLTKISDYLKHYKK